MAFSSVLRIPVIEPEVARSLLLAHVPRRLRLCLASRLRLNAAQFGIAAEVTTLVPDAAGLAAAWVEAADASAGALWLDPGFANAAAKLIEYLDALAVAHDLPALASLADAVVLVSRPGEDRAAAVRLAPSLWMENHRIAELHVLIEPIAMCRAWMGVASPSDEATARDTPGTASAAATEEDDEDGEILDRRRDTEAALESAWSTALDAALLDLRADAAAVVAGLATLTGGAGDDHLNTLALALAAIEVGRRLVVPVEERVRRAESARRKTLTRRLDRMETELRQAQAAADRKSGTSGNGRVGSNERPAKRASKPAGTAIREGYLLAVPPVQENPADKSRDLARGYEAIVGKAIPLAATPDLAVLRDELIAEFPYAHAAIDALLSDLVGRPYVRLRPTILVGAPGSGKSRLAARVAERLGLGPWRVDGSHDGASFLGGTDRRWVSAEPAHPVLAMHRFGIANPLVLIDEIEKATTRTDHGRLWDALLVMLEPATARHYMDPAFQVEVDLSQVSWLSTANTIENLPGPLLDRMRVVEVPSPGLSDLTALLPAVLAGIAQARGYDPRFLEPLDGEERRAVATAWRGGSVRRLARLVEAIVAVRGKTGLPPEKWSSLRYGLAPCGGCCHGTEEAYG